MKMYIGTKIIRAVPMTRAEYNAVRGWTVPADENGADEGYLVEYTDGGKPNHPYYAGYISWSPKAQFHGAYLEIGDVSRIPTHQQRVVGELVQLEDKRVKLNAFMQGEKFHNVCDEDERIRLINQYNAMTTYSEIVLARIDEFTRRKMIDLPVKGEVS